MSSGELAGRSQPSPQENREESGGCTWEWDAQANRGSLCYQGTSPGSAPGEKTLMQPKGMKSQSPERPLCSRCPTKYFQSITSFNPPILL